MNRKRNDLCVYFDSLLQVEDLIRVQLDRCILRGNHLVRIANTKQGLLRGVLYDTLAWCVPIDPVVLSYTDKVRLSFESKHHDR